MTVVAQPPQHLDLRLSFTLPPLLSLILGTAPLIRLEVGHPLPVDLGTVGKGLPRPPLMN